MEAVVGLARVLPRELQRCVSARMPPEKVRKVVHGAVDYDPKVARGVVTGDLGARQSFTQAHATERGRARPG